MATPTALPASFTAGDVLTAANMNGLLGGFRILQVLHTQTAVTTTTTSATFADVTGLSLTITPQSTTNKILVVAATSIFMATNSAEAAIKIVRGATDIFTSRQALLALNTGGSFITIAFDSPATTSATTYKVQAARPGGTGTVTFNVASVAASTLLLLEVSA